MSNKGYYAVDFDATLSFYTGFKGATVLGEPIPAMVDRVKQWIAEGKEIKIMTARVWAPLLGSVGHEEFWKRVDEATNARRAIEDWTELHIGKRLEVTCQKDYNMIRLYDDRAVQVEPNTGRLIAEYDPLRQGESLIGGNTVGNVVRAVNGRTFTLLEAEALSQLIYNNVIKDASTA